ncbi:MAG: translation initiation factor IF-2 [Alphaproteobacteria bacterium]|nr:translation initiation factor IF-2 [Alphaproteobacteria bacterium]
MTVTQAFEDEERVRSLASVRRARERERRLSRETQETVKVFREVVLPETITVQELANRMAERAADVVKALMRLGVMVTVTQSIDADTAELVIGEFGHRVKRVSESDVEIGLKGEADEEADLQPRPPVVTVMGHVDHGKTSLLDAIRASDVAAREAGGITQHIGAYRVRLASGQSITFIDTPGHEAFTQMRARGANVTDIVVLVVAADDGVMPQTVEAINHAKAAGVPMIVAINKIDRPDANPTRVRNELLTHSIVDESLGGDTLSVEVSAIKRTNLERLEEQILLQAEVLDLRANPDRPAEGVVIEARLDRGRGNVATVLVQRGTLRGGDIVVAGSEWGRVRALVDDTGAGVDEAGPAVPVEILGLNGTPLAGDEFAVVDTEARAREITDFRKRRQREARAVASARGTLEQMFSQIASGAAKELPVVVKADVQGSAEALSASLERLATAEVKVRVLHSGVGGINETDISLAKASNALIVGFNVRANPQAREMAATDHVDIRYYSIIYDVTEDVKKVLGGMLSPEKRETHLGSAQVLQVFDISRVGKIAGCRVVDGLVRRGSHVRILRDNVVIHEGGLSSLRRFKDEVREVRDGMECGLAVENYADVKVNDVIECYEIEQVARTL